MKEEIEAKYNIRTEMIGNKKRYNIEENMRFLLFRSVRELLINIVKHAQAKHIQVILKYNHKSIEISVKDDGIGFNYNPNEFSFSDKGFGLFSVQERMYNLGGSMTVVSKPNLGSEIKLQIPQAII
jgi:signal transduction histidine kinase